MPGIGAFLIVRMGSTRLPGKCLKKILGRPLIEHMVERVKVSSLIDKIIITTSTDSSDDPLEKLADKLKICCYRGSLENIMARISNAADTYDCDTIVELLGDNPLVHSDLIDDVIKFYQQGKYDYSATITKEYPILNPDIKLFSVGMRVQVYSRDVAKQWIHYKEYIANENKHPSAYIFEHPETYSVGYFEAQEKWAFMNRPNLSFAVNYRKNFDLIRAIFKKNYPEDKYFSLKKVYNQLEMEKYLYSLMENE